MKIWGLKKCVLGIGIGAKLSCILSTESLAPEKRIILGLKQHICLATLGSEDCKSVVKKVCICAQHIQNSEFQIKMKQTQYANMLKKFSTHPLGLPHTRYKSHYLHMYIKYVGITQNRDIKMGIFPLDESNQLS